MPSTHLSQCGALTEYILNQEEQHRKHSFQEEYVDFLRRGGVEYDERYLW
jgi:putative transposase